MTTLRDIRNAMADYLSSQGIDSFELSRFKDEMDVTIRLSLEIHLPDNTPSHLYGDLAERDNPSDQ